MTKLPKKGTTRPRRPPVLLPGQWRVTFADVMTGTASMPNGRWAMPADEPYFVFSTLDEAEAFAKTVMTTHRHLECAFFQNDGPAVRIWRDEEYVEEQGLEQMKLQREHERRRQMGVFARIRELFRRRQ